MRPASHNPLSSLPTGAHLTVPLGSSSRRKKLLGSYLKEGSVRWGKGYLRQAQLVPLGRSQNTYTGIDRLGHTTAGVYYSPSSLSGSVCSGAIGSQVSPVVALVKVAAQDELDIVMC